MSRMNKKNGFTLIEILAVVTIIGLIFILVLPKITNSLKNKKGDVDRTTTNLVLSATKLYVQEHSSKFDKIDGNISCMPINQLVRKGYLEAPVKNVTDDEDITDIKSVRITYNKGFQYEIVGKKDCYAFDLKSKGYERVEYLESTGTQWIDTRTTCSDKLKIDVKYYINDFSKERNYVFAAGSGSDGKYRVQWSHAANSVAGYGNKSSWLSSNNNNKINELIMDKGVFYLNDGKIYDASDANNTYSSSNYKSIYIFGLNSGTEATYLSEIRIYYMKIYEADNLIHDFIPVIDSFNLPCMYDRVINQCYYNQGTGEFLWG